LLAKMFSSALSRVENFAIELETTVENRTRELRVMTEELKTAKEQADSANRAKSEFLANVSHEIRTPMNAILGFTELLKRGYVKNEKESLRYLNTIHTSGKNLLDLINDILDLSKVESGHLDVEKKLVDPYLIMHEIFQILGVKAREKGIALRFRAQGPVPKTIETDPVRLRQIVLNVVGNAIKFTDQGSVTATCRIEKNKSESQFFIEIMDTGIGMAHDKLEAIFDPFIQADATVTRRFGGTGLGLAISRKFARALGGDITVESEPGSGSIFTIRLASGDLQDIQFLQPEAVAVLPDDAGVVAEPLWKFTPARVLVVDDGAENRELIRLLLEEAGLTVEEAENGSIALEKVALKDYDVILMDVHMPVMDGFTAAGILRQKQINIPIIALTADAMKGYEQKCLDSGYTGYLTKPIDIDGFMKMMAGLLDGSNGGYGSIRPPEAPSGVNTLSPDHDVSSAEQRIVSRLAGNPRLRPAICRFADKLHAEVSQMQEAWKQGDMDEVARLAHWLKGSAGTVGYDAFTEPAAELENYAKARQVELVGQSLRQVKALAEAVETPSL